MFFELFCRIWNPHQVEELTCMCSQALDLRLCVLVTQSCPTLCELLSCSCQGALSMEFSRQEYWSGLPFPSPGDFLSPGIKPGALELQVDALLSQLLWKHQTSDWLETKGWLCWLMINSPAMNQKNVHKLIVNPITSFPHLIFKTFSKKKNFPHSHLGILGFWVLAAWTTCLVPCDKHCILLHCNPHKQMGPGMVQ